MLFLFITKDDGTQSDMFYVDSHTFTLRLKKFITDQNYLFRLFISVSNVPISLSTYPSPSFNNTQLLFVNIIFKDLANVNNFFFVDFNNHIGKSTQK